MDKQLPKTSNQTPKSKLEDQPKKVKPIERNSRKIYKQNEESSSSNCCGMRKRINKIWTDEEDKLLAYHYHSCKGNWKKISENLPQRNSSQCSQRWKRLNPNRIRLRKQWDDEEDQEVLRLVSKFGKNWKKIEEIMQGRTGKQIRERFINNLDPKINHEQFTKEEDLKILNEFMIVGPKWSLISQKIEGRPENMIKNRFYSFIKKYYLDKMLVKMEEEPINQENICVKVEEKEDDEENNNKRKEIEQNNYEQVKNYQQERKGGTIKSIKDDFDSLWKKSMNTLDESLRIGAYNQKLQGYLEHEHQPQFINSLDSSRGGFFQKKKKDFQNEDDEIKLSKQFPFEFMDEEQNHGIFLSIQMPDLENDYNQDPNKLMQDLLNQQCQTLNFKQPGQE